MFMSKSISQYDRRIRLYKPIISVSKKTIGKKTTYEDIGYSIPAKVAKRSKDVVFGTEQQRLATYDLRVEIPNLDKGEEPSPSWACSFGGKDFLVESVIEIGRRQGWELHLMSKGTLNLVVRNG